MKTITETSYRCLLAASAASVLVLVALSPSASAETINVYSERQQVFLDPIFSEFEKESGHDVEVLYLDKGAVPRLQAEGASSPADLVIVADIGRLKQLVDEDLQQPYSESSAVRSVPEYLRDPDNRWLALTKRLRVLYVNKNNTAAPTNFEELSDPKWRGKICLRSGTHPYNVALFASLLEHHGENWLNGWLEGVRDNLARSPQGNDRAQIKGVADGSCGVAIANLYYYFKMLDSKDPEEREAASKVRWIGASIADAGVHVNVSGIIVAKNAPNKNAALELIDFMLSDKAQSIYAEVNGELPVVSGVDMPAELAAAAAHHADDLSLEVIAGQRKKASEMVDAVGFNN